MQNGDSEGHAPQFLFHFCPFILCVFLCFAPLAFTSHSVSVDQASKLIGIQ